MMNPEIRQRLKKTVEHFRLPRYEELPTVGLYLEQVVQYINGVLVPVGCAEITTSMVSNYVKKGFIPSPQKKQYNSDQIVYLMFIAITKNVLSLEHIVELFEVRKMHYTLPVAYDYFCCELENMLSYVFGWQERPAENIGFTQTTEKDFLRSIIISVSHSMYITAYFAELKKEEQKLSDA